MPDLRYLYLPNEYQFSTWNKLRSFQGSGIASDDGVGYGCNNISAGATSIAQDSKVSHWLYGRSHLQPSRPNGITECLEGRLAGKRGSLHFELADFGTAASLRRDIKSHRLFSRRRRY
jgi:hypothetical protein